MLDVFLLFCAKGAFQEPIALMKIKPLSTDSSVARFLAWLAGVVFRHPRLFLYPQLALFVLCIV